MEMQGSHSLGHMKVKPQPQEKAKDCRNASYVTGSNSHWCHCSLIVELLFPSMIADENADNSCIGPNRGMASRIMYDKRHKNTHPITRYCAVILREV